MTLNRKIALNSILSGFKFTESTVASDFDTNGTNMRRIYGSGTVPSWTGFRFPELPIFLSGLVCGMRQPSHLP